MDGGQPTPLPPDVIVDPITEDDDPTGQSYQLVVDVNLTIETLVDFYGNDGIVPVPDTDNEVSTGLTVTFAVIGYLAAPGSLAVGGYNGDMAVEYNANVVIDSSGIVNDDLFAPVSVEASAAESAQNSDNSGTNDGGGYP